MMETLLLREGWATRMESFSIFSLHTWQLLRLDEDTSSRMSRVRSRSTSALPEEAMTVRIQAHESRRPVEAGKRRGNFKMKARDAPRVAGQRSAPLAIEMEDTCGADNVAKKGPSPRPVKGGKSPLTGPSPSAASKSISRQDHFQAAQLAELERIKSMMKEIDDYELEEMCEAPVVPAAPALGKRAAPVDDAAGSRDANKKGKVSTSQPNTSKPKTAQPKHGRSTRSQVKAAV
jgi:hypothetical protein